MELLATGCGDGIWPRCLEKGMGTDSWRKSPSQVTSHVGDVSSPGLKGRDLQRPEAVEGDQTDSWRKSPSQVTSHDGDVYSPGLKGRYLQMPDAGEGYQEKAI